MTTKQEAAKHEIKGYPRISSTGAGTSSWVGWILFAAVLLLLMGAFQSLVGLFALFGNDYFLAPTRDLPVGVNSTVWAWAHLLVGCAALFAGWGVMVGKTWARVVGITLASISAVVNLTFAGAEPWWAVLVIALDVVVIYALAMYGGKLGARS